MPDKNSLRNQILQKRAALSPDILEKSRETSAQLLFQSEEYARANTVMVYMDFRSEVPTGKIIDEILASGKKLVLPLTDSAFHIIPYEMPKEGNLSDYLTTSKYGIAEPDPALCKEADRASIDLVVIPGSVFDRNQNRIGYGKGCYDQFLPTLSKNVVKLALAYDFQVLPSIPSSPTDVKMDRILVIPTE